MNLKGKKTVRVETNAGQVLRVAGQLLIVSALILDKVAARQARQPQKTA